MHNILFLEGAKGFGGATVSLSYLLWFLDKKTYNPVLISSHNSEYWYRRNFEHEVITRNMRYLSDSKVAKWIIKSVDKVFPSIIRRLIAFVIILMDFTFCIFPTAIWLFTIAKKRNIELVHLNNGIYRNAYGIILAKLLRIPCGCHQRGFERPTFLTRLLARYIDSFIAISNCIRDDILRLGVNPSKIVIIPEGIDLSEYISGIDVSALYKEFNLSKNHFKIGMIGCFVEWKGQDVFLRAAKEVISNNPNTKFFLVGDIHDGNHKYRNHLLHLAKELEIENHVLLTGYRENIAEFLEFFDVVVHASTSPEPFGRVIIEAMAMEKPEIAARVGAPCEIIEDGVNGFLVEPSNPSELAKAILLVIKNHHQFYNLKKAARRTVENRYTIQMHARSVENLYKQLFTKNMKAK